MGHYYSEMISDTETKERIVKQDKEDNLTKKN